MTAPLYAMRDHVRRPSTNKSNSPAPQRRKRGFRRLLSWLFKGLVWAFICSILLVILLRFVNPPMWTWRIERALFPPAPMGEVMHQWRDLAHISPELQ